ncbi:MAG: FAD-binding oxidoreductase [Candidatus Helarchaeota archaeon]|nr:FAD-binding oxidoreductase [Candidatus Helarchaeota archaeon]
MTWRDELGKIIGSEAIFDDDEILEEYSKDNSFVPTRKPDLVAKPKSSTEIVNIVRWANDSGAPLIPVSSGPPRFRGDTIPRFGGVVVDLSRMNKIIRVDRRNRVALVEAGVTFPKFQAEVEKSGLRILMPLLPRISKSVVASYLEREPITTPKYHWDYSDPMLNLEIVFGPGEIMRTGDAAGPGTLEEQWSAKGAQKTPAGPFQLDYHRIVQGAQGTMGIVTWASVKCEVLPKIRKFVFAPTKKLESLLDFTYEMVKRRSCDECLFLNDFNLATILSEGAEIESLKRDLSPWYLIFSIAGYDRHPEERVAYLEKDIMNLAKQYGVFLDFAISGVPLKKLEESFTKPSPEPYWKLKFKGGCKDIFFLTTLDKVPNFITTMIKASESVGYPSTNIGAYIQPVVQGCGCHCEFNLPYDPTDMGEVSKIQEFFTLASEALMNIGAYYSRPYGPWANMVYNRMAEYTATLRKTKNIFDPNNIMNPGKLCF